jgi:hypothetical protein
VDDCCYRCLQLKEVDEKSAYQVPEEASSTEVVGVELMMAVGVNHWAVAPSYRAPKHLQLVAPQMHQDRGRMKAEHWSWG